MHAEKTEINKHKTQIKRQANKCKQAVYNMQAWDIERGI